MYVQYKPGIHSSETYPYEEDVEHEDVFKCRYNQSLSVGTIRGYGRIMPGDEELLKNVVANVGPVAFGMNAALQTFIFYR